MISFEDEAALRPFLLRGERVVWTGRPRQGLIFDPSDLFSVPASLAGAAALSWIVFHFGRQDPLEMIPFAALLVGLLYTGVGRFLHEAWARRRLLYAVTSQRMLILHGKGRLDPTISPGFRCSSSNSRNAAAPSPSRTRPSPAGGSNPWRSA